MNKIWNILTALFLLLIFGAPSCVDEEEIRRWEEAKIQQEIDQIYEEMMTLEMTDSVLLIYENTAKNKLADLADYMKILSDTSLDYSMREKARNLIVDQFISLESQVQLLPLHDINSIAFWTEERLNRQTPLLSFSLDSIITDQKLQLKNDQYKGRLGFQIIRPKIKEVKIIRHIDYYLIKKEKVFASNTLMTWTVCFGEIRN